MALDCATCPKPHLDCSGATVRVDSRASTLGLPQLFDNEDTCDAVPLSLFIQRRETVAAAHAD